ncbi:sulfite exporter TauE/SafE family protein [Aeromicrobium halocynthiae]|uniref:Probable membrane transporter protein n=1 Tax=Aeromicrobium halocynthiae TaxID=560557 RepID=A0ABP5HNF9_9ACTN
MLDIGVVAFTVIAVAVLAGTLVQSVIGLGLGLTAAPIITLLAPELMPGTMLVLASVFPVMTLARERSEIDWHGLAWSMPARVVGTVVGVVLVAMVGARGLGIGVSVIVLAAVLLTIRTVVIPITRGTLSGAGFVGGITGTASSIGGPPFALLYQHRPPLQIRTTMAVYFLIGALLSLGGLALAGELTRAQMVTAAALLPVLLAGALISGPLKRHLRPETVRPAVLVVCAASAVVLLVRSLLG